MLSTVQLREWGNVHVPWSTLLAAIGAVTVTVIIGFHGIAHLLLEPTSYGHASAQRLFIILWGFTTLLALGGLAVLCSQYHALLTRVASGPAVDLGILPEDEQQIVKPVVRMPGITQVEVVARSDFSDAKVSQTLKSLRERGLIYREPQGRTYRLYPGTVLKEHIRIE